MDSEGLMEGGLGLGEGQGEGDGETEIDVVDSVVERRGKGEGDSWGLGVFSKEEEGFGNSKDVLG